MKLCKLLSNQAKSLPDVPHSDYPRPRLVRDSYLCLNGKWEFGAGKSEFYDREILVPFPPESILSGIDKVYPEEYFRFYKRTFSIPQNFNKGKLILHFGAVDQIAKVFVNGNFVGEHIGGYTPFSFDITDFIKDSENELKVVVQDNLSDLVLPYGKQSTKRGGMWYTPTSGIWQTVWIESVPNEYVQNIRVDTNNQIVTLTFDGIQSGNVFVDQTKQTYPIQNGKAEFCIENPVWWSPENPYLYTFSAQSGEDVVKSYFAIRTLSVQDVNGTKRICLNGKPYFFHGLLDQGYWSDGQFLPASPEMYADEILKMKALGFNVLRKHIKIEPQRFYYECDKLGMIVFQDMVNNGKYKFIRDTVIPTIGFLKKNDLKTHRDKVTRKAFLSAMRETVDLLYSHPSICYWTIFNEGWGQFESDNAYRIMKELDQTRIIDTTSGWFRCGNSDVDSKHIYFRKIKIKKSDKPVILSEFGGATLAVKNHVFNLDNVYGYGKSLSREDFVQKFRSLYLNEILPAVKNGLCGAIFTQLSDVEDEINGLVTFDRAVQKIFPEEFADVSELLKNEIEK
ncbi:MAG: glycoside hydrolase family 2 [Clostridia bacterium]|nr:glycoside hydrolase family 2 [Clostridia bacterium]